MGVSTDITVEPNAALDRISFEDFIQHSAVPIAHAVAFATNESRISAQVTLAAVRNIYPKWQRGEPVDALRHELFGNSIQRAQVEVPDAPMSEPNELAQPDRLALLSLTARAVVAAHHHLGWTVPEIGTALALGDESVGRHLAEANLLFDPEPNVSEPGLGLGERVRLAADSFSPVLPSATTIQRERRSRTIRSRVAIGVVGLAALATGGTFLANSFSDPVMIAAPAPTVAPATQADTGPTPVAFSGDRDIEQPEVDRSIVIEPPPTQVRLPHLVTIDGQGGFAGARSPAFRNPRAAIFTTSSDGDTWEFAGRWPLSDYEFISRFELIGDRYIAWVDNALAPNPPNPIKLGVSTDLVNWQTLKIDIDDVAPAGLRYRAVISDVAVHEDDVLALVTTEIEIDFGAFALYEGSTCGSNISRAGVTINLCNGGTLDILVGRDMGRMPRLGRLYLSKAGSSFRNVGTPIAPEVGMRVASLPDSFGITNTLGTTVAVSTDGNLWSNTSPRFPPALVVQAEATNRSGDTVGMMTDGHDRQFLFFARPLASVHLTALGDLTDRQPTRTPTVSWGPAGWIVSFVDDELLDLVLLHSRTGRTWDRVEVDLQPATSRSVYVGDNELLIQTTVGTGPVLTRIPLDPSG